MQGNEEIWKEVPGYEGKYLVSNLGRVKSILGKNEIILKPAVRGFGYLAVSLSGGKGKTVHQLVAMAFLNHKPDGHKIVVDHIDSNPLNNRLDNLRLITQRENLSNLQLKRQKSSNYVGVSFCKIYQKFRAVIWHNRRLISIGYFKLEYDAHLAYQRKLKEIQQTH